VKYCATFLKTRVLIFDVNKKISRRLYDIGPVVSTYLDVSKNIFFIIKSCSTPPPMARKCNLKGYFHEIENGYNWYQKTDKKNLVLPEHILNFFQ
jgi:hypothetical protein